MRPQYINEYLSSFYEDLKIIGLFSRVLNSIIENIRALIQMHISVKLMALDF
jgi:hypothetical protein